MNTWKVILATLVIFVAGVVTGGLLVSYADRAQQKNRRFLPRDNVRLPANANPSAFGSPRDPRESPRLPNPLQNRMPRGVSMEFLQKLDSEVRLTAEQHERIEKIIAAGQLRNKELWERVAPEMRREIAETQKRIREELTPEQRVRFEELMKQSRPAGQRKADETKQPERRSRDQRDPRRPIPPRDAPAPGTPENP